MEKLSLQDIRPLLEPFQPLQWVLDKDTIAVYPCFDPEPVRLQQGESLTLSDGPAVILSGSGTSSQEGQSSPLKPGDLTGCIRDTNSSALLPTHPTFTAGSPDTVLLCMGKRVLDGTCFGMSCGSMHLRTREMIVRYLDGHR